MRQEWQPGLMAHHTGFWLVTCLTATCAMYQQTLSLPEYTTMSLDKYLPKEAQQ